MSFVVDTNAISEPTKPQPNRGVIEWLAAADEEQLYVSAATIAELRYGIELLSAGARRQKLTRWLTDQVIPQFGSRVLPVDVAVAHAWGLVLARARATGRSVGAIDAGIAATALHHDFTLVTRNVSDFDPLGVRTLNPWS